MIPQAGPGLRRATGHMAEPGSVAGSRGWESIVGERCDGRIHRIRVLRVKVALGRCKITLNDRFLRFAHYAHCVRLLRLDTAWLVRRHWLGNQWSKSQNCYIRNIARIGRKGPMASAIAD